MSRAHRWLLCSTLASILLSCGPGSVVDTSEAGGEPTEGGRSADGSVRDGVAPGTDASTDGAAGSSDASPDGMATTGSDATVDGIAITGSDATIDGIAMTDANAGTDGGVTTALDATADGAGGTDAGADGGSPSDAGDASTCPPSAPSDFTGVPSSCASTTTCAPDALGRRWSPPIRIDDGTACQTGAVRAAAHAAGSALVAWNDVTPTRVRARRVDGAGKWDSAEPVQSGWGSSLSLAWGGNGDALLVGLGLGNGVVTSASVQGAAWTLTHLGTASGTAESVPSVALDSTGAGAIGWSQSGPTLSLETWSASAGYAAAGGGFPLTGSTIAVAPLPSGGFAVALVQSAILFYQSYSPSTGWALSESVYGFPSAAAGSQALVNIAVDGAGHTHVVWVSPDPSADPGLVYYRERMPDGRWDYKRSISTQADPSFRPLLAVSDTSSVLIVWASSYSLDAQHHFILRDGTASWQEKGAIDQVGVPTYPAIAMDSAGNAVLAWGGTWAGTSADLGLVRSMRYFAGSGWEAQTLPLYVDSAATSAPFVDASVSPSGRGIVAYVVRQAGQPDRVVANTLR